MAGHGHTSPNKCCLGWRVDRLFLIASILECSNVRASNSDLTKPGWAYNFYLLFYLIFQGIWLFYLNFKFVTVKFIVTSVQKHSSHPWGTRESLFWGHMWVAVDRDYRFRLTQIPFSAMGHSCMKYCCKVAKQSHKVRCLQNTLVGPQVTAKQEDCHRFQMSPDGIFRFRLREASSPLRTNF